MNENGKPHEGREPEAETEESASPSAEELVRRRKAEADSETARLMAKLEMDVFGHP